MIRIPITVRQRLRSRKIVNKEAYYEVINRLLDDTEPKAKTKIENVPPTTPKKKEKKKETKDFTTGDKIQNTDKCPMCGNWVKVDGKCKGCGHTY